MRLISGKKAGGFTLAEAMVATVVLGIAAAGVLMPFVAGARTRAEGQRRTLAAKLAADLMERIVSTEPNQIVGTWNFSESQGQVKDMTGAIFSDPAYANYSRTADCNEVYVSQEEGYSDPVGADDPIFIWAKVKVYYKGAELASVSRLIAK
jgi:type II secretory pathway pseudopilin PulG